MPVQFSYRRNTVIHASRLVGLRVAGIGAKCTVGHDWLEVWMWVLQIGGSQSAQVLGRGLRRDIARRCRVNRVFGYTYWENIPETVCSYISAMSVETLAMGNP